MKKWTPETARAYIKKVNSGKLAYGLTYLSACDYLRISVGTAQLYK